MTAIDPPGDAPDACSGAPPAPPPAAARRLTAGVVALLAGLAAVGMLSTNIMLPAFPVMAAALGVEQRSLGVLLSSFFLVFAFGQLLVGPLSDRLGRRPLVLGGLLLFGVGTAVCALAGDLPTLTAGRVLQAAGVCAGAVLSRAIARDLFDGDALAKALSLVMVAMAAAPGFSPLLGGAISQGLGWRAVFVAVGLAAAVLAACYALQLGETHPADRRAAHTPRQVAATYAALMRDGRFLPPALAVSLILGALYGSFAAAPAILMTEGRLSPIGYGLFSAGTVFMVFGAGLVAPRLAQRLGLAGAAALGAGIALAAGLLMVVAYRSGQVGTYAAALAPFLFGMGLANPLGTALTLRPYGAQAGTASALLGFLQMMCAAAGTALVAALPLPPATALGVLQAGGGALALLLFAVHARRG